MPGVRYGPDISDDAAYILDFVKEAQAKLRRGLKLNKKDSIRYESFRNVAENLFGVGPERFDRGQFGDLAELAKYGGSKSRSKAARSWRTGGIMKKSVADEFADRGGGVRRPGGTATPEGSWYMGRTVPKKFRELEQRAIRRANRKGVTYGRNTIKAGTVRRDNFLAKTDKLGIAKVGPSASDLGNRPRGTGVPIRRTGISIRPPLPKSAARAGQRQRKRAQKTATRDLTNKGRRR